MTPIVCWKSPRKSSVFQDYVTKSNGRSVRSGQQMVLKVRCFVNDAGAERLVVPETKSSQYSISVSSVNVSAHDVMLHY